MTQMQQVEDDQTEKGRDRQEHGGQPPPAILQPRAGGQPLVERPCEEKGDARQQHEIARHAGLDTELQPVVMCPVGHGHIDHLKPLYKFHGAEKMKQWSEMIHGGELDSMVAELLTLHYDPSYLRAITGHYAQLENAQDVILGDLSEDALKKIAAAL